MTHRLAIIIPAYKATFLPAALDSIAAQTCKDFTLYVGDDCSPEPIGSVVEQYRDNIELVYQRFDANVGGKDLVAQWERCIAMSREEPPIVSTVARTLDGCQLLSWKMCSHEKSMNKWAASRNMIWHGAVMWQRGLCSLAERVCVLCPMQGYVGGKVHRISHPIIHAK